MTDILFAAVVLYCAGLPLVQDKCLKRVLTCMAQNKVYDASSKSTASRMIADCLVKQ